MAERYVSSQPWGRRPPLRSGQGPLVWASQSESRRALLSSAGFDAEVVAAEIDERAGPTHAQAARLGRRRAFARGARGEDASPDLSLLHRSFQQDTSCRNRARRSSDAAPRLGPDYTVALSRA